MIKLSSTCRAAIIATYMLLMQSTSVISQTRFVPVRINCGGPKFTDPNSNITWRADKYFTTGSSFSSCENPQVAITNTSHAMRTIYCSNRSYKGNYKLRPFRYNIPVLSTNATYTVRLHFAELSFQTVNLRKMHIVIEKEVQVRNLDVYAKVGFQSALTYETSAPIIVSDGILTIEIIPTNKYAMISGIEVMLASTSTSPTLQSPVKLLSLTPSKTPTDTGFIPSLPNSTVSRTPSKSPTKSPSRLPTINPTREPVTIAPTLTPSKNPTKRPSNKPTNAPVTLVPSKVPTQRPTISPTKIPTMVPRTKAPTIAPTTSPTKHPTKKPTKAPTTSPSNKPTVNPTKNPTKAPTVQTPFVYFRTNSTNTLGIPDVNVAIGNPLKGLAGGPRYSQQSPLPNSVPSAIEFYNIGLNEIMMGDNEFNWTLHDQLLNESASRKMHAVISVYIHWPGRPLRLPQHLMNLTLFDTAGNSGRSPNYGDPRLLNALQQFILAWSDHIDGDKRIAAIHVGLLGFWGEGHTYPDVALVPESSKTIVAQWYRNAFKKTQVQTRYPGANAVGFGLYDGSLAYNTLDGAANGGINVGWFQYPRMKASNQVNIWKERIMGGETRPELQKIIFTNTYPARTENHQDYKECIDALHISYALHHDAFQNGGYTGDTLRNANKIHAYMGYAFYVSEVAAITSTLSNAQTVNVSVVITQIGVAPFYYDLSLVLGCGNDNFSTSLPGVNTIIDKGTSKTFLFPNVPATTECLGQVTLSLQSSYAYTGRPILFAQGTNGKVSISIPTPGSNQTMTNRLVRGR